MADEVVQAQAEAQTEVIADWRRQLDASTSPYDARVALGLTDLYQPMDADLTSLAEAETNDAIYYRSDDDTWTPVTIGTGIKFEDGTLSTSGGFTAGDVKLTMKTTADAGWVMMGTGRGIGNAASGSNARANADTHDLFVVLFNNVSDEFAPIHTNFGEERTRGSFGNNADACFNANCQLTMPEQGGRMLTGVGFSDAVGAWDTSVASGSALGRTFWNIMIKL